LAVLFPDVANERSGMAWLGIHERVPEQVLARVEHPHQHEAVRWHRFLESSRSTIPAVDPEVTRALLAVPWLSQQGKSGISSRGLDAQLANVNPI